MQGVQFLQGLMAEPTKAGREEAVIEVTSAMLEEKARQARGDAPFTEDEIASTVLNLNLPEFRKLPGVVQTWAGLYATAKRRHEQLVEVA